MIAFTQFVIAGERKMDIYDFTVTTIDGKEKSMATYKGKVLLIVNVASKCGFTPQYKGLEKLHEDYHDRGCVFLDFLVISLVSKSQRMKKLSKTFVP